LQSRVASYVKGSYAQYRSQPKSIESGYIQWNEQVRPLAAVSTCNYLHSQKNSVFRTQFSIRVADASSEQLVLKFQHTSTTGQLASLAPWASLPAEVAEACCGQLTIPIQELVSCGQGDRAHAWPLHTPKSSELRINSVQLIVRWRELHRDSEVFDSAPIVGRIDNAPMHTPAVPPVTLRRDGFSPGPALQSRPGSASKTVYRLDRSLEPLYADTGVGSDLLDREVALAVQKSSGTVSGGMDTIQDECAHLRGVVTSCKYELGLERQRREDAEARLRASLDNQRLHAAQITPPEAESGTAALEMEVSLLRKMLADAQVEGQKREEHVPGLEKAEQLLQSELAAERSQCARLREELASQQKQLAGAGQSESAKVAALQKQVEMLTAEKTSLDAKLDSALKAQRETQSSVAALDKEVSMLQKMLADAKADAQKRLEQLEAKLAEAEQAKKELAARDAAACLMEAKLREELASVQKQLAGAGQSESAKVAALQKQVEMLTAEKTSLDTKLLSLTTALDETQTQVPSVGSIIRHQRVLVRIRLKDIDALCVY
jgi:chromosome segregation ATPase